MSYDFSKFKDDAISKPRDLAWNNWAKFEKVGDSVQGYIRDVFYRESEGDFKEQRGITLEQEGGEMINVGIKHIGFVLAKTDSLRLNDPLTVVFEKELPAQVKGHSATKQFAFYGKTLDENANEPTVLQMENEDRKIASAAAAEIDKEWNGEGEKPKEEFKPGDSKPAGEEKPAEEAVSAPAAEEAPATEAKE